MGFSKGLYDKLAKRTFVDVAFLPGGGDVSLVDAEFFKRVLARYYVATSVAPTADLLKALSVGKAAWHGASPFFALNIVVLKISKPSVNSFYPCWSYS